MNTLPLILGLALVLLASSYSSATKVASCLDSGSESVTIEGCKSGTCKFKKGKTSEVSATFTATENSDTLTTYVTARLFGIDFPWPGVYGTSACDYLYYTNGTQTSCPLVSGTKYLYKQAFTVSELYPSITTDVTWKLEDGNNVNQVCFKVEVKVESA